MQDSTGDATEPDDGGKSEQKNPPPTVSRSGDPNEFDNELQLEHAGDVAKSEIVVPPGLLKRLLADPIHAAEILATQAVEKFADRAERDVALLRERNPNATDRQIAVYFKHKFRRLARWEGAGTGAAGLLGLPVDLVLLAWTQDRLVLSIAATYGHDMHDHKERAVELLIIQGVHNSREVASRALSNVAQSAAKKLILRHLRKESLTLLKQLFRVVGFSFTRKALLEKGVPLISVPISAGVNDVTTRLLANQAIKYYDTTVQ